MAELGGKDRQARRAHGACPERALRPFVGVEGVKPSRARLDGVADKPVEGEKAERVGFEARVDRVLEGVGGVADAKGEWIPTSWPSTEVIKAQPQRRTRAAICKRNVGSTSQWVSSPLRRKRSTFHSTRRSNSSWLRSPGRTISVVSSGNARSSWF